MSHIPSSSIRFAPFTALDELHETLLANLDQLPVELRILDPDFRVCGRKQRRTILAVDGEGRLVLILPYPAPMPVRVEEVVLLLRTVENFLPWIARIFPDAGVHQNRRPRPVVIAETIPAEVVELLDHLEHGHLCLTYIPIRTGDQRTLLLRPIKGEQSPPPLPPFRDGTPLAWDHLSERERQVLFEA